MRQYLLLPLLLLALLAGCGEEASPDLQDGDVVVALLDTGVSEEAISGGGLLPGWNYVAQDENTQDALDHGTAVASVILGCEGAQVVGLASECCRVVPLVIADQEGTVTLQILAQAIRDSVDRYRADIINLSLGIRSDLPEVRQAVEYAEEQGVLVVSAVGNRGDSTDLYYPAAYDTVLAVGSHDEEGLASGFSQRNGTADLLAPGEDIWLASSNGLPYGARGTSYATGYVSGAAARLLAVRPDLAPTKLREILCQTAADTGEPGWDKESGWGLLDLDAALQACF